MNSSFLYGWWIFYFKKQIKSDIEICIIYYPHKMMLKEHKNSESKVQIMFALLLRFEWSDFLWNRCIFFWKPYTAAWFQWQKVLKRTYQDRTKLHIFHSVCVTAQATSDIFIFTTVDVLFILHSTSLKCQSQPWLWIILSTFSLAYKNMENV